MNTFRRAKGMLDDQGIDGGTNIYEAGTGLDG